MYTSKKFHVKAPDDLDREIRGAAEFYPDTRKIFLADGNALVLSSAKLLDILKKLRGAFSRLTRVSAYASPKDLENKSVGELRELKDAGLTLIYVGIESGDDQVLRMVNKGETFQSIERNLGKARVAGIKSSVMILTGLGGRLYSKDHALNSAALVSSLQPEYLSTLVLSFPYGVEHFKERFDGDFIAMATEDLLLELHRFIGATRLENVIFRSDHASNYLVLKGILGRDKEAMLRQLEEAIQRPGGANLREEWQRGL